MKVKKIFTTDRSIDFDAVGVTLLTVEEAKELPQKIFTAVTITWWLRSPGNDENYVACVFGKYGLIDACGHDVKEEFGVRPALIFKSSDLEIGDKFIAFNYEWTVIDSNKALCNSIIGCSAFCNDWKTHTANDYEKSDIKKYIDRWFTYLYHEKGADTNA